MTPTNKGVPHGIPDFDLAAPVAYVQVMTLMTNGSNAKPNLRYDLVGDRTEPGLRALRRWGGMVSLPTEQGTA